MPRVSDYGHVSCIALNLFSSNVSYLTSTPWLSIHLAQIILMYMSKLNISKHGHAYLVNILEVFYLKCI